MLTEDYVSFETAKLLKEKGFDEDILITTWWYDYDGIPHKRGNYSHSGDHTYDKETCFNCPTIQMAMKWLREKHIVIIPEVETFYADGSVSSWEYHIWCDDNHEEEQNRFSSYEEACEAGIRYCLENLI